MTYQISIELSGDFSIANGEPVTRGDTSKEWTATSYEHVSRGAEVIWSPPQQVRRKLVYRHEIQARLDTLDAIRENYIKQPAWDWYPHPSPEGVLSERDQFLMEYWELQERLIEAPESPKRVKRGQNGITPKGRKKVRSGCTFLEQEWGAKNLTFFTATLGNLSGSEYVLCVEKWGEIIRRFNQKLQRLALKKYRVKALPYVGVTEIQESRWKNRGDIAPHYHVLFPGRKSIREHWRYSIQELEGMWFASVSEIVERDWNSRTACNTQGIKKSAANYISKYLSKGGKIFSEVKAKTPDAVFPTAWYSWSREVRQACEARRIKQELPPLSLVKMPSILRHLPGHRYSCHFALSEGQVVAVFGRVEPDRRDEFVESLLEVLASISAVPLPTF